MKLLFCVNRDIYANLALNQILPELPGDEIRVLFSDRVGSPARVNTTPPPELNWLRFYEQDLPNQHIFPLSDTLPPSQQGTLKSFARLSEIYNIPMQGVSNINSPESIQALEQFAPDLILSIRFGQIFKDAVIQIPRQGVLNLHSGLMPSYRGILGTFWSLLHGESHYGYTLHQIHDASIDTGAIVAQRAFPINPELSLFEHLWNLYTPGAESMLEAIHTVRVGVTPETQAPSSAKDRYYSLPTREDFDAFDQRGLHLLNPRAYFDALRQYAPTDFSKTQIEPEHSGCCQF